LPLFNGTALNHFRGMAEKFDSQSVEGTLAEPNVEARDMLADLACTNTAVRRAARRLGQLYDEALAPIGLKATQMGLLSEIDNLSTGQGGTEGPSLQVLADRLAIQLSALTHALRPLVRDGLAEVLQDMHDRRTKHAVLTTLGKRRLHEAAVLWANTNGRVEAVLGPTAASKLRHLADEVASPEFLDAFAAGKSLAK
jgi:DNA-binding MarR family transcriptional regulator